MQNETRQTETLKDIARLRHSKTHWDPQRQTETLKDRLEHSKTDCGI